MEIKDTKLKVMFGVEHCYIDGASTYEIFETFSKAKAFCENDRNWSNNNHPLFIFKADFNSELIFKENNEWNYDDFVDTILGNYNVLEVINTENNLY